jgi:phosphinothricin acetyltransferase
MSELDLIRDAVDADLPRIVEIYNASIPSRLATADTEPVTIESRHAWFATRDPQRRPFWVLERDGAILAWIRLSSFYGRPAYEATAEVSLYVAPEAQGQGLGPRLFQEMIRRCPDFGVTTLLSFVFGHNEPSLKMNRKLGFEQWGLLPQVAELDGIKRDLVILGLRL